MRTLALLCAALSLAAPLAARADEIPGGHVYLGLGVDGFALFNAPWRNGERAAPFGADASAHLDVEVQHMLFGGFLSLGGNGDVGRLALALTAGRVLTEGDAGLYVAVGAGLLAMGFYIFDGGDSNGGAFALGEVGVRVPRSWQFGRATAALSLWLPTWRYTDVYTPSLQLGLRFEL